MGTYGRHSRHEHEFEAFRSPPTTISIFVVILILRVKWVEVAVGRVLEDRLVTCSHTSEIESGPWHHDRRCDHTLIIMALLSLLLKLLLLLPIICTHAFVVVLALLMLTFTPGGTRVESMLFLASLASQAALSPPSKPCQFT